MRSLTGTAGLVLLAGWSLISSPAEAAKTAIPKSSFNSQKDFDAVWAYNYPWGTDHNGSARMNKDQVQLSNGTMTITAKRVSGQKAARHGGKDIAIRYLSGAINAKEHFTVARGGGLDFVADLKATVGRGTWPAFWLTAVDGWPPEVDMAEWKGSGKVSFNTFNTSSQVTARDVAYPSPGDFHKFRCELKDSNGKDVEVKFFMDEKLVTTQVGRGFTGKALYLIINLQMEGSSGSPGPESITEYAARNVEVVSHNP